ncbi:hypothetical protein [Cupriavidus sp. CP313]
MARELSVVGLRPAWPLLSRPGTAEHKAERRAFMEKLLTPN